MVDLLSEDVVADLAAESDALNRASAAQAAFHQTEALVTRLRDIRDLALNELRWRDGLSVRAISREMTARGTPLSKTAVSGITG